MSEGNNLESNNLCTTEDAFEKFQAVAMFEEDEFITLSDIVPPQPVVPDLSNELNEIPYDNEVVLSCTQNDDTQRINSTVESNSGQINEPETQNLDKSSNDSSVEHVTEISIEKRVRTKPKIRRSKTISNEKRQSGNPNEKEFLGTESNAFTDNQAIQHSALSTTVGKNGTESKNDTQEESKYPRRTRRERIPNTAKYPLISGTTIYSKDTTNSKDNPGRRRGRPKKISLENLTISEPDSTNIEPPQPTHENLSNTECSEQDESSKKTAGKKGKRGRPKVLSHIEVEQIVKPNNSSDKITESETLPLKDLKKCTRRGRKKISGTTEKLSVSNENSQDPKESTHAQLPETTFSQIEENKLSLCETELEYMQVQDVGSNSLTNVKMCSKQDKKKKVNSAPTNAQSEDKTEESLHEQDDMDLDDADDICLSKLKENIQNITENLDDTDIVDIQNSSCENGETSTKRNSKISVMADFEYNIDQVVKETSLDGQSNVDDSVNESLLVEDTSKRPNRRKTKQNFKYDEDSDEDPFANVELSDEDEPRSRKNRRYCSDDEYIPSKKRGLTPVTSSSDTDIELNEHLGEGRKQKRKKVFKNSDNQSPKKRGRKTNAELQELALKEQETGDIEEIPSIVEEETLSMKPPAEAWATSNEFENFIAQKIHGTNLKIKKVSLTQKTDSIVTPLDIPVLDQNDPKKNVENFTQTIHTSTISTGMQTSVPYDIPMKTKVALSSEQSEKACEFLNSVVKTTVELGQLMKEKSEDFMKKKINVETVTDTFKMDYCVRKSFLLFKLAKHNLMQMEEDLAKQYDEFLSNNNLSSCRDELIKVTPKVKADSDSDCEIVDVKEVPEVSPKKEKSKFNPKTVFLNKELSIKIAKKPSTDKNVDIKGRHTVWINDSVMVKKVKPTQSFLAQDSRNKKPPDSVLEKMVSDFFKDYNRQKALSVCAPYINSEWSGMHKEYACHYFVTSNDFDESDAKSDDISLNKIENKASTSNGNNSETSYKQAHKNNPKSLSSLCAEVVCNCLHVDNNNDANEDLTCNLTDGKNEKQPLTLFRLCIRFLSSQFQNKMPNKTSILNNIEPKCILKTVPPLKSLCYQRIADLMPLFEELSENDRDLNEHIIEKDMYHEFEGICIEDIYGQINEKVVSKSEDVHKDENYVFHDTNLICSSQDKQKNGIKPLLSLCVESIQSMYGDSNKSNITCSKDIEKLHPTLQIGLIYSTISSPRSLTQIVFEKIMHFIYGIKFTNSYVEHAKSSPRSLTQIVFENIKHLTYGNKFTNYSVEHTNIICHTEEVVQSNKNSEDFTINCINTMSEEAFHSLQAPNEFQDDGENDDYDYDEPVMENFIEDNEADENEWVSQVQMQELRSCLSSTNTTENEFYDTNIEAIEHCQNIQDSTCDNLILTEQIKLEPVDDAPENVVDSSIVKTEPVHGLDGMTIIPDSIITKSEIIDHGTETNDFPERESSAYDVSTFDQFVRANKMMRSMDDSSDSDEIFSQSALRIRRQHEPDNDAENDMNMSLLVPQTYEPLHIENAKGVLMESSSDEGRENSGKKANKKKTDRKKNKQKRAKELPKSNNGKELSNVVKDIPVLVKEITPPAKEKAPSLNEVAMLTRRMREKIRQEEKKIESSDSESDNISLSLRKDKNRKEKNVKPSGESSKDNKDSDNEIQCNSVDSTAQILEKKVKSVVNQFTGFTAIDQNEILSYQKYMKFVYDKIVPGDDERDNSIKEKTAIDIDEAPRDSNGSSSPIINPEEPVELLECEPTMPIFDEIEKTVKQPKKTIGKKKGNKHNPSLENVYEPKFKERDGWHLYNIDTNDSKLYTDCRIPLEKLPESFVETYLQYHDITNRDNIDKEVNKLANLYSLSRAISIKEGKTKGRQKDKASSNDPSASEQNLENVSRGASPTNSDRFDELSPSEDEGANVDDEIPPAVPLRTTENCIAKDLLMDDHESDSDGGGTKKIKQELDTDKQVLDTDKVELHHKPGPKSKTKANTKDKVEVSLSSESLMLTADKMMNKELMLLHAPITLKEEIKDNPVKEPSPKEGTKSKKRHAKTVSLQDRLKTEDDSSSEEEKQWVSTKEKLLKRIMGKKEDTCADDAKRAKLVDDFIERRGDMPGKRRPAGACGRSARKKRFLERLKQQRILSKELYGDPTIDLTPGGKRGAAAGLFKGRRNIRKVIDKKSLQKSTVLANMEEFERKRRLNSKQNQLRELLGCEEGVNVLVINDEVCLEYDFQQQRPVVTVHPFFTKVMKAHQYEGVKFMWDACFESLESIEAGRAGGGCILAHCMGLGKTLQVLALLHTVLTHPRAAMHRVLVCCPLSTVLNWVDEIHKWIGPVTDQIKVFELSKLKKTYERAYQLEDWYNGGGIFIIGYELFRSLTTLDPQIDEVRPTIINKIRNALLDPGPDIIICDEGHLLKNDCSVLAVAMSRVVTRRRIVLTGTPMQNNLREYYCMVNFVKPNLLGTYSEYSNRFENPIMNGQHRDSREEDIKLMKARTHILHKVLEGCLQRQEASVLYPYLPKKHEYTVFIPLTKCQWDLYKHYVHHYTKESKQSVLKDFHILQKIWSHPQVLHNFQIKAREDIRKKEIKAEKLEDDLALEDKEDIKPTETEVWWLQYLADGAMLNSLDSSNKFVAVFRILHECITLGDKVLIFSTSLFCLDALEYFLREINGWSLGQEYYRLDGSVPPEVRQKWVREFNAENNLKTKLFLISTRAGCLGLNMTAANRVIILDTSWNPAHDIQSIFRVYRFGQKKDCYIYRLVAMGTMEQKIYERSVTKQAVACRVVDEQQIDRHYNMAELTELYRFDESGVGVAGGVAVGVGDVALLRVARDAAVHAVHEHDSLLRGDAEQGLPEHERAAAWMQFQQEHAHKQMQNDLETNEAARALKELQEQEMLQQQLIQQQAQVVTIKTEDGPVHDLLVPRVTPPALRGRGGAARKGRRGTIVQCRIPIQTESAQPGPSREPAGEKEIVRQISDILIKHNFTQSGKGPKQIKELVAKVKQMISSGQVSFDGCDELTASIASVLLQRQGAAPPTPTSAPAPTPHPLMPALTDIDNEPRRARGRPKKSVVDPTPVAVQQPEEFEIEVGGRRRRRKAALAAERQFDMLDDATSQDSNPPAAVIDVDDDDWHGGVSDTDSAPETAPLPEPVEQKPIVSQKDRKRMMTPEVDATDVSILLSDDEAPPDDVQNETVDEPPTPLHPSLLSNQNFIMIVAHTYRAGNPMLDEDAATLAAQYSTLRLLKEFESTGKPIDSGPIYDIAIKVLGESVIKKLHSNDSKSKERGESSAASSKMMELLGPKSSVKPAAVEAPVKKRPGPKSRVSAVKIEPKEMPKIGVPPTPIMQTTPGIVPVTLVRRTTMAAPAPPPPTPSAADECILPDDDDVRCMESEPALAPAPAPAPSKPFKLKLKLFPSKKEPVSKLKTELQTPSEPVRVLAGNAPKTSAPVTTYATICLDSDDEEPGPAPAVVAPPHARGHPRIAHRPVGPVPVALTGPNSQSIPLLMPPLVPSSAPAPRPPAPRPPAPHKPTFYQMANGGYAESVPVSLSAPDSRPVPISMTGPDSRPVPISLSGPGFQAVPISLAGPVPQSIPASSAPMSFVDTNSFPMTFTVPSSGGGAQPMMSFVSMGQPGGGSQPIQLSLRYNVGAGAGAAADPPAPGGMLHNVGSNIYLVPAGTGERVLTCVPAAQVPPAQRVSAQQLPAAQYGSAGQVAAAQRVSAAQLPAAQYGSAGQFPAAQYGSAGQVPVAQRVSAAQLTSAQYGSAGQPVAQRVSAAQLTSAQYGSAGQPVAQRVSAAQLTSAQYGSAGQPVAQRVSAAQLPAAQYGAVGQVSAAQFVSAGQVPAAQCVPSPLPAAAGSQTPTPLSNIKKTLCKPGDILRLTKTGQLELLQSGSDVIHTIDDDEPLALPTPRAPTPKEPAPSTSKAPIPKAPMTKTQPSILKTPKPPSTASLLKPIDKGRKARKVSSSSSNSSNSSRSPSPDPLSILKDVVHIQAPERNKTTTPTPAITSKTETTSKQATTVNPAKYNTRQKQTTPNDKGKNKDQIIAQKLNSILSSVKSKQASGGSVAKTTPSKQGQSVLKSANTKFKNSIDLTQTNSSSVKSDTSKNNSKGIKTASSSKKEAPMTVVGTSKNIVLDVKSKSLTNKATMDLTAQNTVQVTNVKTIPPAAANKQKQTEKKRPAPTPEPTAPKKKKTDLMTLKDFDLDDIDDIIELD